jgi:hypothetical protein
MLDKLCQAHKDNEMAQKQQEKKAWDLTIPRRLRKQWLPLKI